MVDLSMVSTRKLMVMGLLVVVLVMATLLVRERQDVRRGAEVGPTVSFVPASSELSVGETIVTSFFLDTKGAKLAGMDVQLTYSRNKLRVVRVEEVSVVFRENNNTVFKTNVDESGGVIDLTVFSSENLNNLPSGVSNLFKIVFEAKAVGTARVGLNTNYDNLLVKQVETDVSMVGIEAGGQATYVISEVGPVNSPTLTPTERVTPVPTVISEDTRLNFKIAFSGFKDKEAVCGQNWPVNVLVMGQGETAVYLDVALVATDEKTEKDEVIFGASFLIDRGYSNLSNAIFIKGPQHLQVKYGEDGQTGFYNREGGGVLLGMDKNEKVYDFSGYSILAGDITGMEEGVADGRVDGRDFSYVKSKISVVRKDPIFIEMVKGDFDGDCMVGNVDLSILMNSLVEKLDELY